MSDRGPTRIRLTALDGLIFVAALMVVSYHYVTLASAWGRPGSAVFPVAQPVAAYGWLGVEVFFLVSGFVICMSTWGRTLGDFAISRVSRLYPAYWAAVVFTAGVLWLWPEMRRIEHWSDVLVNLSMMQGGLHVKHLDDAYWTLFVELKFYVLFALVVPRGVTYRNCVLFCGLWTAAGVVAPTAGSGLLDFFAVPQFSPYFVAGIAFHLMRRFRPTHLLWVIVVLQFLLAQTYVAERLDVNLDHDAPVWPARLVIALAFAAMAAIALGALDRVQWRWLRTAGAITYPLYLIHMIAGLTVIHHFRDRVPPVPLAAGLTLVMTTIAWFIQRHVERPATRLLRAGLHRGLEDIRSAANAP
ncbi:acyltransferase family protein [Streptomyces sp. NPDC059708]|uniref:acyltransferase family protein n=1 Tax=Streptomyces sp. NPDC059708 TaxID=3346916 RepID=UPI00367D3783